MFDRRDEVFLHLFEQYGDVTFLVLLCGYKVRITTKPTHTHTCTQKPTHTVTTFAAVLFIQGNGKSLRTERAMAVFPKDWVVAGGPSSAKSGMNGQSDSTNGKNVVRCAAAHVNPLVCYGSCSCVRADLRRDGGRALRRRRLGPPR